MRACDPFAFDVAFLESLGNQVCDMCLAGVDEAGRGSLAGPLVAAAVVLDYRQNPFLKLAGLTDSKLLSPRMRESLYQCVLASAKRVSWVSVSAATVDRVGLHRCNVDALGAALVSCVGHYSYALVDGFDLKRPELDATALVRGDYKSAAVAAASVVAKVVRDRLMREMAALYPEYGFESHVGYGTKRHLEALRLHGPCSLHRMSFQPMSRPQLVLWDERVDG